MAKKSTKAAAPAAPTPKAAPAPTATTGYYDALIAAWNNPTQPPPGVTGAPLTSGMSTDQKLTTVNAWTITGAIPTSLFISGPQLINCVNYAEFKILLQDQKANLLALFQSTDQPMLLGGSGNTALLTVGLILDCFPTNGPTIANLTALAKAAVMPWWQAPVANKGAGLVAPVKQSDLDQAGLS